MDNWAALPCRLSIGDFTVPMALMYQSFRQQTDDNLTFTIICHRLWIGRGGINSRQTPRTPLFLTPLYCQGLLYSNAGTSGKLPFSRIPFQAQSIIYNQLCNLLRRQNLICSGVLKIKMDYGISTVKRLEIFHLLVINQIVRILYYVCYLVGCQ